MKQFYTYLHCKSDGVPFYVGKGHGNRALEFSYRNSHHKNVVAKHGRDNIDVFIFPRTSEQDAFDTEMRWIAQFKREGISLANKTDGGEGTSGWIPSEETKARIGTKAKLRMENPLYKKRMREVNKGNTHCKGKKIPDEVRLKMSLAQKGRPLSEEHKASLSKAAKGNPKPGMRGNKHSAGCKWNIGRKASEETKLKMSVASSGRRHTDATRIKIGLAKKGTTLSAETREKISATKKLKKICQT